MGKKNNYLLKVHDFFATRIIDLKIHVQKLKITLPREEFLQHEDVKFAARLRNAIFEVIPEDPNRADYRLHGELKKFRRYKQGLQRYRLFFAFAEHPPIVVYLYLNDKSTLRKEGSKTDPYEIFRKLVQVGTFSHDPTDPRTQSWISELQSTTLQ